MADDKLLNAVWVEKYRPRKIDDVILTDEYFNFFKKCIDNNDIPNLLLLGCQGSGKTTISRIIVDHMIKDSSDILNMNGSDQTGVDVVRDTIVPFLKCPPMASKLKIVYIDEFDYTSSNLQAALRNTMEKYADVGRFICTANYKSKIIDPLHSRFQSFEMKCLSEEYVVKYCEKILTTENIEYDIEDVKLTVEGLNPDIRKIVNTLQQNCDNGKLNKIDKKLIISNEKKICGMVELICNSIGTSSEKGTINQYVTDINTIIGSSQVDYLSIYQSLFSNPNIAPWAKIPINRYCNEHNSCFMADVHFMALIYSIIQAGFSFKQMFNTI